MAILTGTYATLSHLPSSSFACPKEFQRLAMFPTRFSYYNPLKFDLRKLRLSRSPCCVVVVDLDLKLTVHRSSLITPILEKAETTRFMFLSNVDKLVNFNIAGLFFFRGNPNYSFEMVTDIFETAYQKLLVPYDYLAGRLTHDEQGRLVVDCNFAGAGFVVASSELTLEDMGDLVCPRPNYKELARRKLPGMHTKDQPLFIIQLTSLSCGGFVMGYSFNHMMFDGIGCKLFLENLASIARNNSLFLHPIHNRELLAARCPPQISFPHPEFQKMEENQSKFMPLSSRFKKNAFKAFRLSADDIFKLKQEANGGDKSTGITTFKVIVAHIWRCMALAINIKEKSEHKHSTLLYAVNTRTRLVPQVPDSYSGNAIANAVCRTTYNLFKEGSFSDVVQIVAEAEKQITDEYLRSSLDWTEVHQQFIIQGDILLSSHLRLGFTDVVYPWGKAIWYSPVMPDRGIPSILLLPDMEGKSGDGVNILVSLGPTELSNFENFLLNPRT